MKLWLSYSFDSESPFPLYDGTQPLCEPVAVEWNPFIYCESESVRIGGYYDTLPLPDVNIAEIRVESMRAYHLICRDPRMKDFIGTVRILPPIPQYKTINNREGITVVVGSESEYTMACAIASRYNGLIIHMAALTQEIIASTGCLVFPQIKSATSALLCAGLCEGCRIVASDAGSNEEYLTKYAIPGSWHIVHRRMKDHFIAAISELYGVGDWMQLPYCDDAPYE